MQNQAKVILRKQIKDILKAMSLESRNQQSNLITQKLFNLPEFKKAKKVSIYLSTEHEVNTSDILKKLFNDKKDVFVPTYSGSEMKMLRLYDFDDYERLPVTKWKIKQPNADDIHRENAMLTDPLDLILIPGVAFSRGGGRLGHGMGYYDKYLQEYFNRLHEETKFNKTLLVGLGFKEQIVSDDQLPLVKFDYPLDLILTSE